MNTLPDNYTVVKLRERHYPMSVTFKEDGTPVLAACYWPNGTVANYARRTLAITYISYVTAPAPAPVVKKKRSARDERVK